jgi:hypothetical protein
MKKARRVNAPSPSAHAVPAGGKTSCIREQPQHAAAADTRQVIIRISFCSTNTHQFMSSR